jgi:hypothetical protein
VAAHAQAVIGEALFVAGDVPRAEQESRRAADLARCAGNLWAELRALATLIILRISAGMAGLPELLAALERAAQKTQAAQGYLHPATCAGLTSLFHDDSAAARALFLSAIADPNGQATTTLSAIHCSTWSRPKPGLATSPPRPPGRPRFND